eukprot:scaffold45_cov337-Pavlova_lutheri.AAC.3
MTLISGRTALTYAAIPAMSPPPPTGTKIASGNSLPHCRKISIPTVPCPAMTSGSSNGWTNVLPSSLPLSLA